MQLNKQNVYFCRKLLKMIQNFKLTVNNQFVVIGVLLFSMLFSSCASKKDVLYFQDIETRGTIEAAQEKLVIQKNDLLSIIVSVSGLDQAAAKPFNLPAISTETAIGANVAVQRNQAYLVNENGSVKMPGLGEIKVSGLTKTQVVDKVTEKLTEFIIDPVVNVRLLNFRVTVIGDVARPGTYNIENEKVSVIEAIGLAGDMQISGSRQDVLIIRENEDGSKTTAQLDFTKNDLFTSPYYYLKQNDVVVVDPNYAKVQRSASNPNTGIFFSLASLLLSVIVIISR